jgi:hypothetical protein
LNNVRAKINTLIANKYGRASNQLFDFMLTLGAKRAIQNFVCAIGSIDIAQNNYLKGTSN